MPTRTFAINRHHILFASACAAFLLAVPPHAHAQYGASQPGMSGLPAQQQSSPGLGSINRNDPGAADGSPNDASLAAQRLKQANLDRQKRMQADADKLLQLATEIKAEVDHTTKDELSVTVLKKTAEMEKLAHDIRERERY